MFETTYGLLKVFNNITSVYGRKKLQKMIHLLAVSGTPFPFKYEYYHYGPYSVDLQQEVNFMVQQDLVIEETKDDAYVYTITEKGHRFKSMLDKEFEFDINEELLHVLGAESSQFLEMLSTYAYLIDSQYSPEEAKAKALELKPHLGTSLDEVIRFYIEHIKLKR